jgi:hypothetical protein
MDPVTCRYLVDSQQADMRAQTALDRRGRDAGRGEAARRLTAAGRVRLATLQLIAAVFPRT